MLELKEAMRQITIGHWPGLSLKELGGMYLSTFGVLWLAIEPLGAFGILTDTTASIGWFGYIALVVISLLVAVPASQVWRNLKFQRQEFMSFVVESSIEGVTYKVKAPANTQVWDFSHLFIEHLEKGPASDKVRTIKKHYSPVLNVRRGNVKSEVDNNITLKEADVHEGDVLYISGKLIEPDLSPRFSLVGNSSNIRPE